MTTTQDRPVRIARVILVHGYGATTDSHWFPWLSRALPHVDRIALPFPTAPHANAWIAQVHHAIGTLSPDTAIVTHSLGGITALRAIAELEAHSGGTAGSLVAVAPFARKLPPTDDAGLNDFIDTDLTGFLDDFDPATVRGTFARAAVIRSDNDPIVPASASDEFAAALGATVDIVTGAGHFLDGDGITSLPAVLRALNF